MKTLTLDLENLGPSKIMKEYSVYLVTKITYSLTPPTHTHANVEHLKRVQFPKVPPTWPLNLCQLPAK